MSRAEFDELTPAETRELVDGVKAHLQETTEFHVALAKMVATGARFGG